MVVYRKSDRIKLKFKDLVVSIAPLSFAEKSAVHDAISKDPLKGSIEALKYCLKDIEGLTLADGSKYELEFEGDKLTDNVIDDLTNIEGIDELYIVALNMLNAVPKDSFINPATGEPLEGIEIIREKAEGNQEKK